MRSKFLLLFVFALIVSLPVFLHAEAANDAEADEEVATATKDVEIDTPEMTMQVDNALPATFRGGDPDSECVHVLEDAVYKRQEHTLLYEEDATGLSGAPDDAVFTGPPTTDWTDVVVNADGSTTVLKNQNTNEATNSSEFPEPGSYQVHNGGARQVGYGGGGVDDLGGGGETPDGAAGVENPGAGAEVPDGQASTNDGGAGTEAPGAGAENPDGLAALNDGGAGTDTPAGQQRLTSTQTLGVVCHDVTSPCVWAAFQELAGSMKNVAESEEDLKNKLREQVLANQGSFLLDQAPTGEFFEKTSVMAVFEFPKNREPDEKTAAVSLHGPLFNEIGTPEPRSAGLFKADVLDRETQTRIVTVTPNNQLKGIYVRRNVPFLLTGMATDNGDKCTTAGEVECSIEIASGGEYEKEDGAYLFRVPNYPRENYDTQPDYEFVMKSADVDGNVTVVRLPLFVLDTQVSYEGGRNE